MNPITITFDIARADAIAAGLDQHGERMVVATPSLLTDRQRAALARLDNGSTKRVNSGIALGNGANAPRVPALIDEASLPAYLDQVADEIGRADAKAAADEIERQTKRRADIEAWLAAPSGAHAELKVGLPLVCYVSEPSTLHGSTIPEDLRDAYRARLASERTLAEQKKQQADERRATAEAAATAKRATGEAALRTWALAHGSERARLMIELQAGEWEAIAQQDFVDAHAPSGYSRETYAAYDDSGARKRPTIEELQALRAARKAVEATPAILSEARLDYCTEYADADDEEGRDEHYTCVVIDVRTPDDAVYQIARRLP